MKLIYIWSSRPLAWTYTDALWACCTIFPVWQQPSQYLHRMLLDLTHNQDNQHSTKLWFTCGKTTVSCTQGTLSAWRIETGDAFNACLLSATSCQLYGLYQFWTDARKWRSPGSIEIQNCYKLILQKGDWFISKFNYAWEFHNHEI